MTDYLKDYGSTVNEMLRFHSLIKSVTDDRTWKQLAIVIVISLVLSVSSTVQAKDTPDTIAKMQAIIEKVDTKIEEITKDLSVPGLSKQTLSQLNRERKNQFWVKSRLLMVIFEEEELIRKGVNKKNRRRVQIEAFSRLVTEYYRERQALKKDHIKYNADVVLQVQAVRRFKALPPSQQTKAEHDRLNDRYSRLNIRAKGLDSRVKNLEKREKILDNWWKAKNIPPHSYKEGEIMLRSTSTSIVYTDTKAELVSSLHN